MLKRIAVAVALVAAFVAGFMIRPSGIHDPAEWGEVPLPAERGEVDNPVRPSAQPLTTGHQAAEASCVNPGNPRGYCWYVGWKFPRYNQAGYKPGTLVCLDSSIPGHPLAAVAADFRRIDPGIRIAVYNGAGQCKAHGYPKSRYVTFYAFTAHDKRSNPNTCGLTLSGNYGAFIDAPNDPYRKQLPMIKINVTGTKTTPCGASEWVDVFKHEMGHAFGLSHTQPRVTSIMRDGHSLDAYDMYYIRMIMFGDARGVPIDR
jgi:hypothetical protein